MKRLILGLIAVLFLSVSASAEITFVLKDGSKVTWGSYTETRTHYCKGSEFTSCIDKANVDTIREVIGNKKGNSSQTDIDMTKHNYKPTKGISNSSSYIESLFARIDREIELGSPCKEITPFLERLSREYDSLNEKQKAKFNVINKVCQKEACLEQAEAKYKKAWIRECEDRREAENCSLHVEIAKSLNDQLRYDKNACKE